MLTRVGPPGLHKRELPQRARILAWSRLFARCVAEHALLWVIIGVPPEKRAFRKMERLRFESAPDRSRTGIGNE